MHQEALASTSLPYLPKLANAAIVADCNGMCCLTAHVSRLKGIVNGMHMHAEMHDDQESAVICRRARYLLALPKKSCLLVIPTLQELGLTLKILSLGATLNRILRLRMSV